MSVGIYISPISHTVKSPLQINPPEIHAMPMVTFCLPRTIRVLAALALSSITLVMSHGQTVVTAGSLNGVLNPTQYAGSDIGAKINTAWKSGATVRVPAGSYSFSTTIVHPGDGYKLECDTGAVLSYTGSGDAITLANGNLGANQNAGIDGDGGCILSGTSSAQSGIHIYPSNHTYVRNIRITGFTNSNYGYAIYNTGGNSVEINNVSLYKNRTGVYLTGSSAGYASNAVHISDSDISNNSGLGVDSENSGCGCTANLGTTITNNVFEGNAGGGDVKLDWDQGASVTGNYFESNGVGVNIGQTQKVRAIATNLASKATAETQLSLDQIRKILEHAFNGELSIIEQQFEKVKTGYALPLETGSGTALVFTPPELMRFGFSHDDLEATERMLDR